MSPPARVLASALLTLALTLPAAACGGADTRQARRPSATPSPSGHAPCETPSGAGNAVAPADVDDPASVGCAALSLLFSLDTTVDSEQQTQHAGELRAAASSYVTFEYAERLRARRPIPLPGDTWQTWTRHRAYISVQAKVADSGDAPADSATTAYRQYHITNLPTGRDGWRGRPIELNAFAKLTRGNAGRPWRVDELNID